jgi:DNA-directed RNA polymerase II subunit RPB1
VLINEIREVIKPYDIYVNYRHLSILVDWMTHRGKLTPINRNGLNRIDGISCLRKSSFEETVEILYDATIFSEIDKMSGVTENIIFG